jgi:hypothetical protein
MQYEAAANRVVVWTYDHMQSGYNGDDIPVTFVNGDQFGARALADGTVEVYRNGVLIATRDISAWPHNASGGYLGLWFGNAKDALVDDFGGGTIPDVVPTDTSTPTETAAPTATDTPTATSTDISTATPTDTLTSTPTDTLTPTSTDTPPTPTFTPTVPLLRDTPELTPTQPLQQLLLILLPLHLAAYAYFHTDSNSTSEFVTIPTIMTHSTASLPRTTHR